MLTHVDTGASTTESIGDAIELARAAEMLGYESFWVAQHRFGHQGGAVPSPLILLAAIAQHTTRIQLGTASIAPAFEDPRRLLEDAAVLDTLSAGRLQLGLGSGSSEHASQAWGMDHGERHHRYWAAVDALRDGAERGIGTDDRSPVVPALMGLDRRLWVTTGSTDGARAAAQRRMGLIAGRRAVDERGPRAEDGRVAELIRHYRAEYGAGARVAVSRPIIATSDSTLARGLRKQERRARGNPVAPPSVLIGAPDEIVAKLHEDPARGLIDHLLVHTRPLTVPLRRQIASLELIAERVRPETESILHKQV